MMPDQLRRESNEELAIREYSPRDLEAMYRLDVECFDAPFRFSRRAMREFAEAPGAVTVIVESSTEMAGFAIAHVLGGAAYMVTVDVAQSWRGRGLGRLLIEEVEHRVMGHGALSMELHVFAGNDAAQRLYRRLGYTQTGIAEDFYGGGLSGLSFRKEL